MSNEQRNAEDRIELEPVTCWPLIYAAVGFVCLGLLAVGGLVLWGAIQPRPEPVAHRDSAPPAPREARAVEAAAPEQSFVPHLAGRQVIVKRELLNDYTPLPPPSVPLPRSAFPRPAAVERPGSRPQVAVKAAGNAARSSLLEGTFYGELALREMLWKESNEVDLEKEKGAGAKVAAEGLKNLRARLAARGGTGKGPALTKTIRDLLENRDDLRGLPLADEKDCQTTGEAARWLGVISTNVRRAQARRDGLARPRAGVVSNESPSHGDLAGFLDGLRSSKAREKLVVRPVAQMFEVETPELREEMVATLAAIPGKEASQAIARRAVFDLSPRVRKAAVEALADRPTAEVRPVLLAGLRHPWPRAAFHAASALAALNDQNAVEPLQTLEGLPDPCEPFQEDKKWYVRELVRVNHLRNCLLCHSPTADSKEGVPAPVPTPGKPLPELYYGSFRGGSGHLVRADVVYFRQDFSVMHPVADAKPWPEMQRFDYLVRKRELTSREALAQRLRRAKDTYPQREAVREALAALRFEKVETGVAKE